MARSTAAAALASFDAGDIEAVLALVAPTTQFRFISVGSAGAVYDRTRVEVELRRLFDSGERVVRSAYSASDNAAVEVRVFIPETDPSGLLIAGVTVLYHDGGAVKLQISCLGGSIIGISWDSVAVGR